MLQLDAMKFLEEGLCQLLKLRVAGTAATLLAFPQAAVPLYPVSPFDTPNSSFAALFSSTAAFSSELPGRFAVDCGLDKCLRTDNFTLTAHTCPFLLSLS